MSSARVHQFEARMTELTARYMWPMMRSILSRTLSARCRRCILSERAAAIDGSGVCSQCRDERPCDALSIAPIPRAQLDEALGAAGSDRYDAVVLLSGGKDSAYLLDRLRGEYPHLRVLALLVDNGFMSPVALDNAAQIASRLAVPLRHERIPPSVARAAFRYTLTHLHRQTGYSIVDLMDGTMTFDTGMRVARELGARTVLGGLGPVQLTQVFEHAPFELLPEEYKAPLEGQLGVSLDDILDPGDRGFWYEASDGAPAPRFLLPLTVWDPSEEDVVRWVTDRGLLKARNSSPLVTNNALVPVIGMAEVARRGYCGWELEFADMVRTGRTGRAYWLHMFEMLEYSTRTGRFINGTVERTLDSLGLAKADIGIGA